MLGGHMALDQVEYFICLRGCLDCCVPHALRPDPHPSAALREQNGVGACRQHGFPSSGPWYRPSHRGTRGPALAGVHSDVLADPYPAEKILKHFIIELLGSQGKVSHGGKVLQ